MVDVLRGASFSVTRVVVDSMKKNNPRSVSGSPTAGVSALPRVHSLTTLLSRRGFSLGLRSPYVTALLAITGALTTGACLGVYFNNFHYLWPGVGLSFFVIIQTLGFSRRIAQVGLPPSQVAWFLDFFGPLICYLDEYDKNHISPIVEDLIRYWPVAEAVLPSVTLTRFDTVVQHLLGRMLQLAAFHRECNGAPEPKQKDFTTAPFMPEDFHIQPHQKETVSMQLKVHFQELLRLLTGVAVELSSLAQKKQGLPSGELVSASGNVVGNSREKPLGTLVLALEKAEAALDGFEAHWQRVLANVPQTRY